MEIETGTKDVNVEIRATAIPQGLPVHAKLAHVLAVVVSGVIAVAVSIVLADGGSVITLKDVKDLPVVTAKNLKEPYGINYRLDELLGPTYGIGLHHDHSGRTWSEAGAGEPLSAIVGNLGLPAVAAAVPYVIAHDSLKHPVPLLQCNDLKMAGMCAMALGFIADAVAVVMVVFHALALAGLVPSKLGKMFAGLIWTVLSAGFLVVICLAVGIYDADWKCDNVVIPQIKLSEHFDYNYGFVFAIVGYISAVLILCTTLCFTSTKDGEANQPAPGKGSIVKALCGVVSGCVVAAAAVLIVMGANDFYSTKPADPNVNPCAGQKPKHADFSNNGAGDKYFKNVACMKEQVTQVLEQAGANVTRGYKGLLDAGNRYPITSMYDQTDLCPVNVHWHLGAEHFSAGEYDKPIGYGPAGDGGDAHGSDEDLSRRQLAGSDVRRGYRCRHYDATDSKFTTQYDWKHCTNMLVGETYEIHWPHSAAGACGTKWQYQSPFYDGVFCKDGIITLAPLNTYEKIGVQGQVFTIVNDEAYYYPDLFKGMIRDGVKGEDIAMYTGSTTGTSRDNEMCSRYTPITWQVDRKCHMISASSFDKLCADMLANTDDMSGDVHPHGARELVDSKFVANNQVNRK